VKKCVAVGVQFLGSAKLFAPDKLAVRRIHGEKVTFYPNEIAFVTLSCTDEMTLRVTLEKLSMNDVNVSPALIIIS
jgi:hypothetical protein